MAAQYPETRRVVRESETRQIVTMTLGLTGMTTAGVGFAGTLASFVAADGGGDTGEITPLLGPSLAALGVGVGLLLSGYVAGFGWDDPMEHFHHIYNDELRRDLELPKRPGQPGPCTDTEARRGVR